MYFFFLQRFVVVLRMFGIFATSLSQYKPDSGTSSSHSVWNLRHCSSARRCLCVTRFVYLLLEAIQRCDTTMTMFFSGDSSTWEYTRDKAWNTTDFPKPVGRFTKTSPLDSMTSRKAFFFTRWFWRNRRDMHSLPANVLWGLFLFVTHSFLPTSVGTCIKANQKWRKYSDWIVMQCGWSCNGFGFHILLWNAVWEWYIPVLRERSAQVYAASWHKW